MLKFGVILKVILNCLRKGGRIPVCAEPPVLFQESQTRLGASSLLIRTLVSFIPAVLSSSFSTLKTHTNTCTHARTHRRGPVSRLHLHLSVLSKCISLGWVAASYSMSEWSQLGRGLMNHFLIEKARKSLSELRAATSTQHGACVPSAVEPGAVCNTCAQTQTHTHTLL